MKLEKIITLANEPVRLPFLAMERSLRASGCALPLLVIPYDDKRFELPKGAEWWEQDKLNSFLSHSHPMMRKYACLLTTHYQFVDSDVVFLKNPEAALLPHSGFITADGHWRNPSHTMTPESEPIIRVKTTNWPRLVFNAGQFACDRPLFDLESLFDAARRHSATCIDWIHNDQPGMNLLVNLSGVEITNLTLPPHSMESTWAGDYPDSEYPQWHDGHLMPYLLHWAGLRLDRSRRIDELFYSFLSNGEQAELRAQESRLSDTRRAWLRFFR